MFSWVNMYVHVFRYIFINVNVGVRCLVSDIIDVVCAPVGPVGKGQRFKYVCTVHICSILFIYSFELIFA